MATPKKVLTKVNDFKIINNRVMKLDLKPQKRVPNFKPGQFLHLTLDKYDYSRSWPESRVFSIASSPSERKNNISLIISKQGRYTKRIFSEIKSGKEIWIKLPYGDFTIENRMENKAVFIAGGTGISPFLSILKSEIKLKIPVELYFGIRNDEYFINKHTLLQKKKDNNFYIEIFLEEQDEYQYKYKNGKLNIAYIFEKNKNDKCNYFISGPKEMINNFSDFLLNKNVNKENIIIDEWE